MIQFSKTLLAVSIALLLLWQLPWCYNFFTSQQQRHPFTLYSCVIDDFTMTNTTDCKGIRRTDMTGREYTEAEFDSILPMFYVRQLTADGRFPDTIAGVAVTPRMVQNESFLFRHTPEDINAPVIGLYPLLESMSGRVDLKMPSDVFRLTQKGIQFIDMATNSIDETQSHRFTQAMTAKGFVFPAITINGHPTTRKEYDEGYLLLDANRQLFHLKRVQNRPYVRHIELPTGITPEHLFITEYRNRRTLAFLTDTKHRFYVLTTGDYRLIQVGIPAFNPTTDGMAIFGYLFDWTIRVSTPAAEHYYAIRADDYSLIKQTSYTNTPRNLSLRLRFTSSADKFVKPRM